MHGLLYRLEQNPVCECCHMAGSSYYRSDTPSWHRIYEACSRLSCPFHLILIQSYLTSLDSSTSIHHGFHKIGKHDHSQAFPLGAPEGQQPHHHNHDQALDQPNHWNSHDNDDQEGSRCWPPQQPSYWHHSWHQQSWIEYETRDKPSHHRHHNRNHQSAEAQADNGRQSQRRHDESQGHCHRQARCEGKSQQAQTGCRVAVADNSLQGAGTRRMHGTDGKGSHYTRTY